MVAMRYAITTHATAAGRDGMRMGRVHCVAVVMPVRLPVAADGGFMAIRAMRRGSTLHCHGRVDRYVRGGKGRNHPVGHGGAHESAQDEHHH